MSDYANALKWAGIAVAAVVVYKAWQDSGNFLCNNFGILCPKKEGEGSDDPATREYWEQIAPPLAPVYDLGKQTGQAIQDTPAIVGNLWKGDIGTWYDLQAKAPPGPVKTAAVVGTAASSLKVWATVKGIPDAVADPTFTFYMSNPAVTGGIMGYGANKLLNKAWDLLTCPKCAATKLIEGIMPKADATKTNNDALIFEPGTGFPAVGDDAKYLGFSGKNGLGYSITKKTRIVNGHKQYLGSDGFWYEEWYPGQTNIGPDGRPLEQTNNGTLDQAVMEPSAKKLIPGFNAPMDQDAIEVPATTQDKGSYQGQYAVYNAPKPAAPKMCPDDKGNLVVCP